MVSSNNLRFTKFSKSALNKTVLKTIDFRVIFTYIDGMNILFK